MIVVKNKRENVFTQKPYEFISEFPLEIKKATKTWNVKEKSWIKRKDAVYKTAYIRRNRNIYAKTHNTLLNSTEKTNNKTRYSANIDSLISDCKEAEELVNKVKNNYREKLKHDKQSKNYKWAIKEYIAGITSNNWQQSKDIKFLLHLNEIKQTNKRAFFNSELMKGIKASMTMRTLVMSSFGKKKIWKPQRYIPSRQVILANSIEELNNLYTIHK